MARKLTCVCAAVLARGLSGCTRELCTTRSSTDLGGLIIGFLCFGADYPGLDASPYASAFASAPTGRLTLLGGHGSAARLRGGGTFAFSLRGATPRPEGRLRMRLGKPRPCPRRTP